MENTKPYYHAENVQQIQCHLKPTSRLLANCGPNCGSYQWFQLLPKFRRKACAVHWIQTAIFNGFYFTKNNNIFVVYHACKHEPSVAMASENTDWSQFCVLNSEPAQDRYKTDTDMKVYNTNPLFFQLLAIYTTEKHGNTSQLNIQIWNTPSNDIHNKLIREQQIPCFRHILPC